MIEVYSWSVRLTCRCYSCWSLYQNCTCYSSSMVRTHWNLPFTYICSPETKREKWNQLNKSLFINYQRKTKRTHRVTLLLIEELHLPRMLSVPRTCLPLLLFTSLFLCLFFASLSFLSISWASYVAVKIKHNW